MDRDYYVVDAFTSVPFGGNAAAVVLQADGLTDDDMRGMAREFNLSETTFVLPPQESAVHAHGNGVAPLARVRFRWFTPTVEVNICGHATIAGVHALVESGRLRPRAGHAAQTVQIETRSGLLTAYVEALPGQPGEAVIWLDLIDPTWSACPAEPAELARLVGISADAFDTDMPPVLTMDRDILCFVRDVAAVNAARLDRERLIAFSKPLALRGLTLATVYTLTPTIHVQSRFFAPAAGVDEDPVTGSMHGPLAAYLVARGRVEVDSTSGVAALQCVQGIPGGRTGLVWALVQPKAPGGYGVRIGGRTVTTMVGRVVRTTG